MKNQLTFLWKSVGCVLTLLTYQAWLESFKNKKAMVVTEQSNKSLEMFKEYPETFTNIFQKAVETVESIDKDLSNSLSNNNKFMGDNTILNIIIDFKDYLSHLSTTELCIIMNIFMNIFIFTCLLSITFAFYGNCLIEKLSLEKRYPKFSSLIRLRVKLQHYYLLTNNKPSE